MRESLARGWEWVLWLAVGSRLVRCSSGFFFENEQFTLDRFFNIFCLTQSTLLKFRYQGTCCAQELIFQGHLPRTHALCFCRGLQGIYGSKFLPKKMGV